jgi:hypothetical protein
VHCARVQPEQLVSKFETSASWYNRNQVGRRITRWRCANRSNTTQILSAADNAFSRSPGSPAFGRHRSLIASSWSPTLDDHLRQRHRTDLDSNSGPVGPGTGELAFHRTRQARAECRCRKPQWSAARELLDVTLFARFPLPERWCRDYDTDSGLAVADASRLRRKLAWFEHTIGQGGRAIWGRPALSHCVERSNHNQRL